MINRRNEFLFFLAGAILLPLALFSCATLQELQPEPQSEASETHPAPAPEPEIAPIFFHFRQNITRRSDPTFNLGAYTYILYNGRTVDIESRSIKKLNKVLTIVNDLKLMDESELPETEAEGRDMNVFQIPVKKIDTSPTLENYNSYYAQEIHSFFVKYLLEKYPKQRKQIYKLNLDKGPFLITCRFPYAYEQPTVMVLNMSGTHIDCIDSLMREYIERMQQGISPGLDSYNNYINQMFSYLSKFGECLCFTSNT